MKYTPMNRMATWDSLFDQMFPEETMTTSHMPMRTDIKEFEHDYVLEVDLPGYDKNDIQLSLDHGTLKIHAEHNEDKEEKDDNGRIIRKERYTGSYTRSFYVGNHVKDDMVSAKFDNGTLTITVPKFAKEELEEKSYIEIGRAHV